MYVRMAQQSCHKNSYRLRVTHICIAQLNLASTCNEMTEESRPEATLAFAVRAILPRRKSNNSRNSTPFLMSAHPWILQRPQRHKLFKILTISKARLLLYALGPLFTSLVSSWKQIYVDVELALQSEPGFGHESARQIYDCMHEIVSRQENLYISYCE